MNLAGIILCSLIAAIAIVLYRLRQGAVTAHRRFAEKARAHMDSAWNLEPFNVRPEFQDLRPGRSLGLLRFLADLRRGDRFRWINCTDTTMFGCMKMHTFLFIPAHTYNLPMMSIDIIFAGKRRVFVIEIIDPAQIEDDHVQQHCQSMLGLKPSADVISEKEVTYWYKDILAECSIHTTLDATDDDLIFKTYCAYLDAYAAMAKGASPAPGHAETIREKQHWYVQSLIDRGGPAVDMLAKLMGQERALAYIWSTMFGYDEQGNDLKGARSTCV
jgi:hypothetical protein